MLQMALTVPGLELWANTMLALVSRRQVASFFIADIIIISKVNFQYPASSWGQIWLASRSCGLSHKVNIQHPVSCWGQSWLASRSCGLSHKV